MRTNLIWISVLLLIFLITVGLYVFYQIYSREYNRYFYVSESLEEPYGLKYNKRRLELGMILLPDRWFTCDTSKKPGIFHRTRKKQDHFWLNQVWRPIDLEYSVHYEKEIRRTTEGLVYELDRFRKVCDDSLKYILELKYNYFYEPRINASLIKAYSINGIEEYKVDSVNIDSLDSLMSWVRSEESICNVKDY